MRMLSPLSPIACGGIGAIIPTAGVGDIPTMAGEAIRLTTDMAAGASAGAASTAVGLGDGDITTTITITGAGIPDIIGAVAIGEAVACTLTVVRMATVSLPATAWQGQHPVPVALPVP